MKLYYKDNGITKDSSLVHYMSEKQVNRKIK